MKEPFLILIAVAFYSSAFAQNPYEEFGGKKYEVLTLSKGKFKEVFDEDSIVQIGTVLFNTNSNQIVAFVKQDTSYSEASLKAEVSTRWLSLDPLASRSPFISPYVYVSDNPILRIDPDGKWDIEVHAFNNRGTFGYAIVLVKNNAGDVVYRTIGRVQGSAKAENNYNPRNRLSTDADMPTGVYSIGAWSNQANTVEHRKSYGPNDVLQTTPSSGEILTSGRGGIWMHGGRQETQSASGAWTAVANPSLVQTYGCLRVFDNAISQIKDKTIDLQNNDANEHAGQMNVNNDLQFDTESNRYYLPTEKSDLDNARNNLHWEGDFGAGVQKIQDLEGKGINSNSVTPPPANAQEN